MEAIHDLSGGDLSPLGLVVRIREDWKEDLIREKFQMFKWTWPTKFTNYKLSRIRGEDGRKKSRGVHLFGCCPFSRNRVVVSQRGEPFLSIIWMG
jgi:hypothetical protein